MPANALMQPRIDGTMQATPRNALLGYIADALNAANNYANKPNPAMPMGKANPPLSLLANALGVGDLGATADNLSYGRNLTQGQGMARQMLPETANALMTAGPLAAKFPRQAAAVTAGLLSGDANAARAAMVWHGSPHKFDKFDSSKIGTGEGAQAYGHGLYLAESPDVAKSYQAMSPTVEPPPVRTFRGAELDPGTPQYHAARLVDEMSLPQARKMVSGWLANPDPRMVKEAEGWAQTLDLLNQAQSKADFKRLKNTGSLYKVDLPDSAISRMLDWDKPLSQQAPEVQAAAQRIAANLDPAARKLLGNSLPTLKGGKLYELIASDDSVAGAGQFGAAASNVMRQQGIPGIRYLDGGSRGAGAGTSNFVVFPGEENMLSILERNGRPIK